MSLAFVGAGNSQSMTTGARAGCVVVACATALSGCTVQAGNQEVSAVAARFLSAAAAGERGAACALLTPRTRDDLAVADGPCEESLPVDQLGGSVTGADTWSDWARVSTGTGALFLTRFDTGWRVAAAGCQSRGEAPYRCVVGG